MKKHSGGNFVEWLLIFVAISVVIFAIVVPKNVKYSLIGFSPFSVSKFASSTSATTRAADVRTGTTGRTAPSRTSVVSQTSSSVAASALSLGAGNASGTNQPADEYISIENRGKVPVNISGYRLENGKSLRAYAVGSSEVHYSSDTAVIPQGTRTLSPTGRNVLSDIILQPGEIAFVVTGSPGNLTPPIVSFKENKCMGYMSSTYRFVPAISQQCPAPRKEPGLSSLSQQCQDFVSSVRACHAPKLDAVDTKGNLVDSNGEDCKGCVDGVQGLTTPCKEFIFGHLSYAGCLATHSGDADFESRLWHVYLYRPWEMWASSRETIFLYDRQGQLVAQTSY